jgi:nucleoside-diphosphate-sugar epimerase
MKIIIPGASGFIGRNLLLGLPNHWDIVALYNNSIDFLNFLSKYNLKNVNAEKINLLDIDDLNRLVKRHGNKFDGCVYLAANGDPAVSVHNPIIDIELNTFTLIKFLDLINIKRLVYFSSGAVYDRIIGKVSPKTNVDPTLPYAISKLASEHYIKFYNTIQKKIDEYVAIRFFGTYGPFEPNRKIFNRLIQNFAIEKNNSFRIKGDGNNLIDAMYIDDTIEGIRKVLDSKISNVTVDFASGDPITLNELVIRASRLFGHNSPEIFYEGIVPEYIKFSVDTGEFNYLFKFKPTISLEEGLMKFYKFLKIE